MRYEFRTDKQKERNCKHQMLVKAYKSLAASHPEEKNSRIIAAMAANGECGYTSIVGIRNILKKYDALNDNN